MHGVQFFVSLPLELSFRGKKGFGATRGKKIKTSTNRTELQNAVGKCFFVVFRTPSRPQLVHAFVENQRDFRSVLSLAHGRMLSHTVSTERGKERER